MTVSWANAQYQESPVGSPPHPSLPPTGGVPHPRPGSGAAPPAAKPRRSSPAPHRRQCHPRRHGPRRDAVPVLAPRHSHRRPHRHCRHSRRPAPARPPRLSRHTLLRPIPAFSRACWRRIWWFNRLQRCPSIRLTHRPPGPPGPPPIPSTRRPLRLPRRLPHSQQRPAPRHPPCLALQLPLRHPQQGNQLQRRGSAAAAPEAAVPACRCPGRLRCPGCLRRCARHVGNRPLRSSPNRSACGGPGYRRRDGPAGHFRGRRCRRQPWRG